VRPCGLETAQQVNRATRHVPRALSRAAGAPGWSTGKGGKAVGGANLTSAAKLFLAGQQATKQLRA